MYKGEEMSKLDKLKELLKSYQKVAIAYSGGCDSNFLYQVALQTLSKENVLAVLCVGKMMSKEDIDSARMMAGKGQFIEVPLDVFTIEQFTNNRKDRCYHCKKQVMAKVIEAAQSHDFKITLDGKNADDEKIYRPGMKACEELGIVSPLALEVVYQAEALLHQKGIYYARVRVHDKLARIEVERNNFNLVNDEELILAIKELGFDYVTLDLEGITSGSYDR